MFAEERRSKILDLLEQHGSVETGFLVQELHTSRETIRRDLNELAAKDLLTKTHGGALVKEVERVWHGVPLGLRESKNSDLKKELCAYAARKISEKDIIFIDNSSTALMLAEYIPKNYKLTIVTNSLKFLQETIKYPDAPWTMVCIGGVFTPRTLSTNGYIATSNLGNFLITKAFLSCYGIGDNLVVSDSHLEDMEMKHTVVKMARNTFLLADTSKFGRFGGLSLGLASDYTNVITDHSIDAAMAKSYTDKGCRLEIAPAIL